MATYPSLTAGLWARNAYSWITIEAPFWQYSFTGPRIRFQGSACSHGSKQTLSADGYVPFAGSSGVSFGPITSSVLPLITAKQTL